MSDVSIIPRRFIEEAGNTTQALGLGRVVGQIFAYLYFSEVPRTLDNMKEALGISKGSASMGVRQLEQWGAVQRVWVKGDRKDYYTANDYFGQIIRNILMDLMGKRLTALVRVMDHAEAELGPKGRVTDPGTDHEFIRDRILRLRKFQQKVEKTMGNPLVRLMLR